MKILNNRRLNKTRIKRINNKSRKKTSNLTWFNQVSKNQMKIKLKVNKKLNKKKTKTTKHKINKRIKNESRNNDSI